jgi:hypothetical protein
MSLARVPLTESKTVAAVAVCVGFLAVLQAAPGMNLPTVLLLALGGYVLVGTRFLMVRSGLCLKWPRVRLAQVMIVIALIAVVLRVPAWLEKIGPRGPAWWEAYWREKPARDTWSGSVTIQVKQEDDLASVLARFKSATARPGLRHGLRIYVDTGGLHEAGRTLVSPLGTDLDAEGMPAREFLGLVLKPLGLACKFQEGKVMVTSEKSLDEPHDYGDHGELFCNHNDGPWVPIQNETLAK